MGDHRARLPASIDLDVVVHRHIFGPGFAAGTVEAGWICVLLPELLNPPCVDDVLPKISRGGRTRRLVIFPGLERMTMPADAVALENPGFRSYYQLGALLFTRVLPIAGYSLGLMGVEFGSGT